MALVYPEMNPTFVALRTEQSVIGALYLNSHTERSSVEEVARVVCEAINNSEVWHALS